jgi:HAMP domain-containing protein
MATCGFSPFVDRIILQFKCPKCGKDVEVQTDVPIPDFSADTHCGSQETDSIDIICEHCYKNIEINLSNGICGGDVDVPSLADNSPIKVLEHYVDSEYVDDIPDDYLQSYIAPQVKDILNTLNAIDILYDGTIKQLLYRTLYAAVISCMEAYLSATLMNQISKSKKYKIAFVQTFEPFKNTKFCLSEIYDKYSNIDKLIKDELSQLIYHRLPQIKPIYQKTLNVNLGDISRLMKAVVIRHDIVHRNGQNKDKVAISISKQEVIDLAAEVSALIQSVERQLNANNTDEIKITL